MARHQRVPTQEAGYTYAVVPCAPSISLLAKRRSPYTVIGTLAQSLTFVIFANVRLGSKAAVSCQGNRAGECKPGLILGIVFDTAPGIAETIELLIDSRWGSNSMTKKHKPKWDYAVLYPKPFNFDEAQLAEIREHVLSAADVSADHIKEFLTIVEDEVEGYRAYKIIEDTQPTIAEIRAAISEIEAITQGTLDRLGAIDSSSRRIWAPHLDHSLFTQMEGLTVSPDFYLRNDFRDNIDVTKRLLNIFWLRFKQHWKQSKRCVALGVEDPLRSNVGSSYFN